MQTRDIKKHVLIVAILVVLMTFFLSGSAKSEVVDDIVVVSGDNITVEVMSPAELLRRTERQKHYNKLFVFIRDKHEGSFTVVGGKAYFAVKRGVVPR